MSPRQASTHQSSVRKHSLQRARHIPARQQTARQPTFIDSRQVSQSLATAHTQSLESYRLDSAHAVTVPFTRSQTYRGCFRSFAKLVNSLVRKDIDEPPPIRRLDRLHSFNITDDAPRRRKVSLLLTLPSIEHHHIPSTPLFTDP